MAQIAAALEAALPRAPLLDPGVTVFVAHDLGIRALRRYFPDQDAVIFADTRPDGVRTDPVILAHELGHAMSLPHYTGPDAAHNLMQVGGTDVRAARNLTAEQVAQARVQAATGDAF